MTVAPPASRTSVPGGTLITRSSPSRPARPLPSPCRPRSATKRLLSRKALSPLSDGSAARKTDPPSPPGPPSGPPRGTYFSRRNETQPFPPLPPMTVIVAWSTSMGYDTSGRAARRCARTAWTAGLVAGWGRECGDDADELAQPAPVLEPDETVDPGEETVVPPPADVLPGLETGAALADQDRSPGDELAAEPLHSQTLGVAVAAVPRAAAGFLVGHRFTSVRRRSTPPGSLPRRPPYTPGDARACAGTACAFSS